MFNSSSAQSRCVSTILFCVAAVVTASTQSTPQRRLDRLFPAPAGYELSESDDRRREESFFAGGQIGTVVTTGDRYFARLNARATPLSPGAALRHYVAALRAQGGHVFRDVYSDTATLEGRIPGTRPVWIRVEVGPKAEEIEVTVIEESPVRAGVWPIERDAIPGMWRHTRNTLPTMSSAENREALALLDRLAATSVAARPRAMGAEWNTSIDGGHGGAALPAALKGYRLIMGPRAYAQYCATCKVEADQHVNGLVGLNINDLRPILTADTRTAAADGIMLDPRPVIVRAGLAALDQDRWLLTRPSRPPLLLPVTSEEYLESRIRRVQESRAERKTQEAKYPPQYAEALREMDAAENEMLSELRRQLDGLSPAARTSAHRDEIGMTFVRINTAYFDPSVPPGRAQVIIAGLMRPVRTVYEGDFADLLLAESALMQWVEIMR